MTNTNRTAPALALAALALGACSSPTTETADPTTTTTEATTTTTLAPIDWLGIVHEVVPADHYAKMTENDDALTGTPTFDVAADASSLTIVLDDGASQVYGSLYIADLFLAYGFTEADLARLTATRALDGIQEADTDTMAAFWTYHATDGLRLTITDER